MSVSNDLISDEARPSPQSTTPRSTLLSLPLELQHLIVKHLDWPSLSTLRLTSKHLGANLLPTSTLRDHHLIRAELTSSVEIDHFTREANNLPHLARPRLTSWSSSLPCYHCLRWLPTTYPTGSLSNSAFTRRMALQRPDVQTQSNHRRRICITCGIRTKLYVRGNRVGHRVICYGCGSLGEELARTHFSDQWTPKDGPPRGHEVRLHHYCRSCVERDRGKTPSQEEIQAGMVPASLLAFRHWRQMGGYEAALRRGKEYRLQKGARIRRGRGLDPEPLSPVEPKRTCQELGEKRWCLCWKWTPTRSGFLHYYGPRTQMW